MLGIPLIYALVFGEFVLKFQKLELGKKNVYAIRLKEN